MKPEIHFHYQYGPFTFRHRTKVKAFIMQLFKEEHIALERLDYVFCTDSYLLELNRTHLNHDTYTDIITFPLSAPNDPVISDIYISIDRVKENAATLNNPFAKELYRVIFHGALHLCGFKDKTKKEKQLMREKEEFYLGSYFVPRETL